MFELLAALALPLASLDAAHVARLSGVVPCTAYIAISGWPGDSAFTTTVPYTVDFGFSGPQGCSTPGEMDPNSFTFNRLPRTSLTSYFTLGATQAVASAVPLLADQWNEMKACVMWMDWSYNEYTICDQKNTYMNAAPAPRIDPTPYVPDAQNLARCAESCFTATYAHGTVPYFTLDTPRQVVLVYHGDRLEPRPFVHLDLTHPGGTANVPTHFRFQVKVSGSFRQFANGETTLYFAGASNTVRLGGQLADVTGFATGSYDMEIHVSAYYASSGRLSTTVHTTRLVVVNETTSPIARGWTIGGLQRAYVQGNGSVLIAEGNGSAVFFNQPTPGAYTTPIGEFSRLTVSGSGSGTTYTRTYPDSSRVVFNNLGQMRVLRGRLGDSTVVNYDGSGRAYEIVDPTGRTTSLYYGGTPGLDSIMDPMGRVTRVTVLNDSLRAIRDPDGDSTRFTYDGSRRLATITDRRGSTSQFVYRSSWKLDSLILPAVPINGGASQSPVIKYGPWQTVGVPTGSTSGSPFTPVSAASVQASVRDPELNTTAFTVDRWGQPVAVTDALSQTTTITRAGDGLPRRVAYPSGGVDSLDFNLDGLLTYSRPAGGAATNISYGSGWAQADSIWDTDQPARRYWIGWKGTVFWVRVGGLDSLRTFFYTDTLIGRDTLRLDPKGHRTTYRYDASTRNLQQVTYPGNRYVQRWFDQFGRDTSTQVQTEPRSRVVYDLMNRATTVYDSVGASPTLLAYDPLLLTRVRDPNANVYRFEFNALGWLTRRFDPADTLNRYDSYRYNRAGDLTGWTNRRGQALSYAYDALHRLLAKTGTNTVADSFGYSSDGRRIVAWNAVVRDSFFLNTGYQPDSTATLLGGQRFRLRYRHNGAGALDSIGIASSTSIAFVPRRYARYPTTQSVDTIIVNGINRTRYTRNADGNATLTRWPTAPELSRTTAVTSLHDVHTDSLGNGLNGLLGRGYGYDALGRLRRELRPAAWNGYGREFSYDRLGRLSKVEFVPHADCEIYTEDTGWDCSWAAADSQRVYTYDALGNRTDNSGTYGSGNRIQSFAGYTFAQDLDGNDTLKSGGGQTTRYHWSAEGGLDSVVNGSTRLQYSYDALGRLVRRRRDGANERHLLWDRDQLVAELDGNASRRIAEYVYRPGVDQPLAIVTGATTVATTRYFVQDELGNVSRVVDGSSTPSQRIVYDAWGVQQLVAGTLGDTNRLRWKGLVWEGDVTQLYYMRNRWYERRTGRFVSEDPVGLAGGLNVYVFGNGDPVGEADPYGLCGPVCRGVAMGAALGAGGNLYGVYVDGRAPHVGALGARVLWGAAVGAVGGLVSVGSRLVGATQAERLLMRAFSLSNGIAAGWAGTKAAVAVSPTAVARPTGPIPMPADATGTRLQDPTRHVSPDDLYFPVQGVREDANCREVSRTTIGPVSPGGTTQTTIEVTCDGRRYTITIGG